MSHLSRFSLFVISCLLAFLLMLLGLRLVFSPEVLSSQLYKSYPGAQFQLQAGDFLPQNDGTIDVIGDALTDKSQIVLKPLSINTNYYQFIDVYFNNYSSFPEHKGNNGLFAQLSFENGTQSQTIPLNFPSGDADYTRLELTNIIPPNEIVTGLSLYATELTAGYQLFKLDFVPKAMGYGEFSDMLLSDFSTLFSQKNQSPQNHWLIAPPQLLIFLFFALLVCFYSYFLFQKREVKLIAWWSSLAFTWLLLDGYFLYQALKEGVTFPEFSLDWQMLIFPLIQLLSAWLLATALMLACLKKRYGHRLLAFGGGFVLAWLILAVSMMVESMLNWQGFLYAVAVGEIILACVVFYFFRARICSIDELRLEKSVSGWLYLLNRLLLLIIVLHIVWAASYLSASDFLDAGFLSHFVYGVSDGFPHQSRFVWIVLGFVGLGSLIFAGLRHLDVPSFSSMTAVYLLLSLPLWTGDFVQSIGFSVWLLSVGYVFLVISLVILSSYHDRAAWFIFLLSLCALFVISRFALIGGNSEILPETTLFSLADLDFEALTVYSLILVTNFFVSGVLYLMPLAVLGALFLLLTTRYRNRVRAQSRLLLWSCISILPIVLAGRFVFGQESFAIWLTSSLFWVMILPVISVIPVAVFQLLNRGKDNLLTPY